MDVQRIHKTIPFTVEEAALIDGCNKIQAIVKVVLPMISSGLFAVGLYAFMLSWEEFLFAYTFTGSEAPRPLPWPLYADRRGYQRLGRHYGRFHHDGSARADFLFQRSRIHLSRELWAAL